MNFKELHNQSSPLIICNVWDAMSARTAQQSGVKAIGTSSAAIASMLGYEDGEKMSFSELCSIVKNILAASKLPLTVDVESGYSREPKKIIDNIKTLIELGVVGINIEDSVVGQKRELLEPEKFAKIISFIKEEIDRDGSDLFVNVRTDVFLLGVEEPITEAKKRAQLYEKSGADGVFLPCIESMEDIKAMIASTSLPVNVMCMPNLPDFKTLRFLGVKRISMGNFLYDNMYGHYKKILNTVITEQNFRSVFE